jgi:HPt (histidine-containing phosphotransfer) domain-containing protein
MVAKEDLVQNENDKAGEVLLDFAALQETCLNKEALINKLLNLFVQQTPEWIEEIESSVAASDSEKIRRICHTVKGATSALQATACVNSLGELHEVSRGGNMDNAHELGKKSVSTLNRTKDLIMRN